MNDIRLIGRVSQDVEVRYTKTGKAVASFSIAVGRKDGKDGQKESVDFIPIVCWQRIAEEVGNTLSKGNEVFVAGRMQTRSYETADGQKRRISEVVANFVAISILDTKKSDKADFGQFGTDVTDEMQY